FQRGLAGLAERRGPPDDSFWTWREAMYGFLGRLSPDDVEAIAAFAYMEMLERGFGSVGEFHYLHHGPDGAPYADIGEMGARVASSTTSTASCGSSSAHARSWRPCRMRASASRRIRCAP